MSYGLHGPGPREWRDMTSIYISIEQAMLYVLSITIIHTWKVCKQHTQQGRIHTRVDSDRETYMIPCIHGIVSDTLFTQHVSLYPHHKHQETGQDISRPMCSRPFHFTPSAKVETHRQCNLWTHWCARELCWLDVAGGFRWAEDIRSRCSQLLHVRARHSQTAWCFCTCEKEQLLSIWCSLVRWPRCGSPCPVRPRLVLHWGLLLSQWATNTRTAGEQVHSLHVHGSVQLLCMTTGLLQDHKTDGRLTMQRRGSLIRVPAACKWMGVRSGLKSRKLVSASWSPSCFRKVLGVGISNRIHFIVS